MSKKYPVVYICNYSGNYNFVIGEELSRRGYILLANLSSDSEKLRLRQLELCDLVYVDEVESINIRMRTEIAYAKILGKRIISNGIGDFDDYMIPLAQHLAKRQYDECAKDNGKKPCKRLVLNPWMDEYGNMLDYEEAIELYGKRNIAKFVMKILNKNMDLIEEMDDKYERVLMYCRELGLKKPEDLSPESINDFLETWDEYDPCPELK